MKIDKYQNKIQKKRIQETKLYAIPYYPVGSFAVHIRDHLRSNFGISSGLGIICGASFITKLLHDIILRGCFDSAGGTMRGLLGLAGCEMTFFA